MPKVRTLTPGASPLHHFGAEVRRARGEAGLTLAELGALVPCDNSTVSRIEAGLIAPDLHFAAVCDRAFPFARGWFTRFYGDSQDWTDNSAFPPAFRKFADDEAEATALLVFEPAVIPGLLQTEDYARAVLSRHPGVSDEQVTSRLAARMARQSVLTGEDPPAAWFVVDEMTLHREIGNPKIMHEALCHVTDIARLPNVTVRVIPAQGDYHVGLQGSFNVAEKSGAVSSVFVGDITDGRTTDDAATVADVAARFRHLQSLALPASLSRETLDKAVDRWTA